MIIPIAGPNFVQGAWAGYSGRFMFTPQDYERHWALEGPQHEPLYVDGFPIFPDNPPRFGHIVLFDGVMLS